MKVGDLIQLSSYGKKRGFNLHVKLGDPDQTGLVIKHNPNIHYSYKVLWSKGDVPDANYHRRELKYAVVQPKNINFLL